MKTDSPRPEKRGSGSPSLNAARSHWHPSVHKPHAGGPAGYGLRALSLASAAFFV